MQNLPPFAMLKANKRKCYIKLLLNAFISNVKYILILLYIIPFPSLPLLPFLPSSLFFLFTLSLLYSRPLLSLPPKYLMMSRKASSVVTLSSPSLSRFSTPCFRRFGFPGWMEATLTMPVMAAKMVVPK